MIKDPEREEAVNAFYQYFFKHQSKTGALKYIQENYDPDFSYSSMRTLLSSEFYKGTYRGAPYCPAYLSTEDWDRLQKISDKNIKVNRSNRVYLFSGLIYCPNCNNLLSGCGCSSIINRKTGAKRTYCYYRCNKAYMDNHCNYRHRLSQNLVESYLLEHLEDEYQKYHIRSGQIHEKQKKEKKRKTPEKLRSELERLNLLFQKGRVEWEYYNKEYSRIEYELKEALAIQPEIERDVSYVNEIIQSDFRSMYAKLSLENRRAFWRSIISDIHVTKDSTVKEVNFL